MFFILKKLKMPTCQGAVTGNERALVTAPVASPRNGLALFPPRPREEEQEGALIMTRSQARAPTTTTSFSVLPSLRSVKCPKPAAHSLATTRQPEMLGSKEADSRAVARQGRGLARAGSGNTSHIPSTLRGQSAQPSRPSHGGRRLLVSESDSVF